MKFVKASVTLLIAATIVAPGCQHQAATERHTSALSLTSQSLAQRQAQTRRYETQDEVTVLSASAAVLQDLGFLIDESTVGAGLVVGSKNRDAVETGQVAGQLFLAALVTAFGGRADPVWERDQKIRLSIATRLAPNNAGTIVRVTFQRIVWNTRNQISRVETLDDPRLYQEFFEKLSQSVFLEAQEI